jgi:hypothetical protein
MIILNPRVVEIQSMSESQQLKEVEFYIRELQFETDVKGDHSMQIAMCSIIEEYRDGTQYLSVCDKANMALKDYWGDLYEKSVEDLK